MLGLSVPDWIVLFAYFAGTVGLGLWTLRKVKSSGDYFMGGRRFGKLLMVAQAFGVGTHTDQPVSVSGAAYTNGLAGIWYQWIYLFATPFFWLVAPIYRRLRYVTMADFFEFRYGKGIAMLYTFVGMLYFAMNMGVMLKGTGVTVEGLTGGVLREEWVIVIATVLFVSYGLAGGIIAAVYTDLIQGILILILSFMLIPFALKAGGGLQRMAEGLPDHMFSLVAPSEVTLWFIIAAVVNGLVHVVVLPHHMAIGGAGKSEIASRSGWTYGNFLKRFATAGWAFTGVFAAFLIPGLTDADRELAFGLIARELLPTGFVGLMFAAMIAAVMSTCDAFMVHASALYTQNFHKRFVRRELTEEETLKIARMAGFGIVVGGLVFAYGFPTVVDGIKEAWKVTAYMGVAFWMGILWRRANHWGAICSALAMFLAGSVSDYFLGWSFAAQVTLYIPVGFFVCVLVSLLTRPEEEKKMDEFYLLLDTPVGFEKRLHAKGVRIVLEGHIESAGSPELEEKAAARRREDGLILVDALDLLRGRRRFTWQRYKVDLIGFAAACGLAAATIGVVWLVAGLVR